MCFFRLDNKSAGRQSIASNLMKPEDDVDDGDSMAAYGEGDTGKKNSQALIDVQTIFILNTNSFNHQKRAQFFTAFLSAKSNKFVSLFCFFIKKNFYFVN